MMESICHLAQVLIASVTATFVLPYFFRGGPRVCHPINRRSFRYSVCAGDSYCRACSIGGRRFSKRHVDLARQNKADQTYPVLSETSGWRSNELADWYLGFLCHWQNRRVWPRLRRSRKD